MSMYRKIFIQLLAVIMYSIVLTQNFALAIPYVLQVQSIFSETTEFEYLKASIKVLITAEKIRGRTGEHIFSPADTPKRFILWFSGKKKLPEDRVAYPIFRVYADQDFNVSGLTPYCYAVIGISQDIEIIRNEEYLEYYCKCVASEWEWGNLAGNKSTRNNAVGFSGWRKRIEERPVIIEMRAEGVWQTIMFAKNHPNAMIISFTPHLASYQFDNIKESGLKNIVCVKTEIQDTDVSLLSGRAEAAYWFFPSLSTRSKKMDRVVRHIAATLKTVLRPEGLVTIVTEALDAEPWWVPSLIEALEQSGLQVNVPKPAVSFLNLGEEEPNVWYSYYYSSRWKVHAPEMEGWYQIIHVSKKVSPEYLAFNQRANIQGRPMPEEGNHPQKYPAFDADIDPVKLFPVREISKYLKIPEDHLTVKLLPNIGVSQHNIVLCLKNIKTGEILARLHIHMSNRLSFMGEESMSNSGDIRNINRVKSILWNKRTTHIVHPGAGFERKTYINLNWMAAIERFELAENLQSNHIGTMWYSRYVEPYLKKCGFEIVAVKGNCRTNVANTFWRQQGFNITCDLNYIVFGEETRYHIMLKRLNQEEKAVAKSSSKTEAALILDLFNIKNEENLGKLLAIALKSLSFDRKVVIALEHDLINDANFGKFMHKINAWKEDVIRGNPKMETLMKNLIILRPFQNADDLKNKLREISHLDLNGDRDLVFTFAKDTIGAVRNIPAIGKTIRPVFIREEASFTGYYYPVLEIVALSLMKELLGVNPKIIIKETTKSEDTETQAVNYTIKDVIETQRYLVFVIIPTINQIDINEQCDRFENVLRALCSA